MWLHGTTRKRTVISRHPSHEVPAGTLHKILRDLDIDWDEFRQA